MTTTDTHGRAITNGGIYHLWLDGGTDGTETEIKVRAVSGTLNSIGDALKGQTLSRLTLQCSIGSILTTCKLYSPNGGVIASYRAGEILAQDGPPWNLDVQGLAIQLQEGMVLKINTTD